MEEKTVTLVSGGLLYGGAEGVFTFLANQFAENGYEVTAVFVGECQNERYLFHKKVRVYKIGNKYTSKILRELHYNIQTYKLLRKCPKPIISFRTTQVFFYGLLNGKVMIYSLRNDIKAEGKLCSIIRNILYKKAQRLIFQVPGFLDYFSENIRKKSVVIPNPISSELPVWSTDHHEKVVITASRLEKQKNLALLLEAFQRFHELHNDYVLMICGVGTLEKELKQQCKTLGIEDCVQFLGYRNDIHELERKSAIFALSSDYEGLSNAMLEALAIGIPTICTDSSPGGARTYIENGVNGLLVPVGDNEAFFRGLCTLAENESLCKDLSRQAQQIREELQPDKIFHRWNKLIE